MLYSKAGSAAPRLGRQALYMQGDIHDFRLGGKQSILAVAPEAIFCIVCLRLVLNSVWQYKYQVRGMFPLTLVGHPE